MAGKSDYLESAVLNHLLGGPDYVRVATVYLALFNVAPTDAGGGTEVSGGGYARIAITNDAINFPAAVAGAKSLATQQVFTQSSTDWGTVVAMAFFDADPGGNMLFWAPLVVPQPVPVSRTALFRENKITFRED